MKLLATVVRPLSLPSAGDTTTALELEVIVTIRVSPTQTEWLRNENVLKLPDVRGYHIGVTSAGNLQVIIDREGFMFVRIANPTDLAAYGKKVFKEAEKALTAKTP